MHSHCWLRLKRDWILHSRTRDAKGSTFVNGFKREKNGDIILQDDFILAKEETPGIQKAFKTAEIVQMPPQQTLNAEEETLLTVSHTPTGLALSPTVVIVTHMGGGSERHCYSPTHN